MVDTGMAVYKQGEVADSLHVVLSGRLRSVVTTSNRTIEAVDEFGKGDLLGMVAMICRLCIVYLASLVANGFIFSLKLSLANPALRL